MTKQQTAEANRRHYEELRAAGQDAAPRDLPPATGLNEAPLEPGAIVARETVPPGWYHTVRLRRGEALRIIDISGRSSVSMIGWRRSDPSERLNCADTVKIQWTAALSKGRVILTDMGHVFLSLIEDTSGAHDVLVGGSTPSSVLDASGEPGRNTQENFLAAASKLGLGLRDIPPCITFFAPVVLDGEGRFGWAGARKKAGDFVDLRAEMDLVLVLSNCAHPLDPTRPAAAGPVSLIRHRAPAAVASDTCRTMSPEIARAFDSTDRLDA